MNEWETGQEPGRTKLPGSTRRRPGLDPEEAFYV
jgi:hypothetical protein